MFWSKTWECCISNLDRSWHPAATKVPHHRGSIFHFCFESQMVHRSGSHRTHPFYTTSFAIAGHKATRVHRNQAILHRQWEWLSDTEIKRQLAPSPSVATTSHSRYRTTQTHLMSTSDFRFIYHKLDDYKYQAIISFSPLD